MNQREHKRTHRMAPAAIALCALLTGCQAGTGDAQEPTPASHDEEIVITTIQASEGIVNDELVLNGDIGIPADELPHIFSPFYRARNADSVEGHGIGLALSKAIIEKYGGRIAVSSTQNRGTLFEIYLPPHASGSTTPNA